MARATVSNIGDEPVDVGHKPTDEQEQCLAHFATGESLAIEAGAGAGKTSTLVMMAKSTKRKGQYIAFNKALVEDSAGKFPSSVGSRTAHSLAYRAVQGIYGNKRDLNARCKADRMKLKDLAAALSLTQGVSFEKARSKSNDRALLEPWQQASITKVAVERFCQSADKKLKKEHVPWQKGLSFDGNAELRELLLPYAAALWADNESISGTLPFGHHSYLKLFELKKPYIEADYVLVDEAQDLSPVLISIVQQQAKHAQLVWVGDSCQPTGTRVKVVVDRDYDCNTPCRTEERSIERVKKGDWVVSYDVSSSHLHRRGRLVTGISSQPFKGELVCVEAGTESSRYTPDHRCVVRLYEAFADKHLVYVMRRDGQYRIGRTTGRMESQRGRFGAMMRVTAEGADALWILAAFDSKEEAALKEWELAFRFGVPTLTFNYHGSSLMDEGNLALFWSRVGDNSTHAAALFAEFGRDIRYPLWEAGEGSLLVRRAVVTRACNLMSGMHVLVANADAMSYGKEMGERWWKPIRVSRQSFSGRVYSMDVDEHQTYVGDNIVTHNCQQIYEFTGAENALQKIKSEHQAMLSQSFRFGDPIAAPANLILGLIPGAELRLRGFGNESTVGPIKNPQAVLTRTNAAGIEALLAGKKKVHIVGGGEDVIRFCWGASDLQEGKKSTHPDLACFDRWDEVQKYVEDGGDDLKLLVKLVDRFTPKRIAMALRNMPQEFEAEVIYSTAHKSKGREWDTVQLASDFIVAKRCKCEHTEKQHGDNGITAKSCFICECENFTVRGPLPSELRLLYVAVTRAKKRLDLGPVSIGPGGITVAVQSEEEE